MQPLAVSMGSHLFFSCAAVVDHSEGLKCARECHLVVDNSDVL